MSLRKKEHVVFYVTGFKFLFDSIELNDTQINLLINNLQKYCLDSSLCIIKLRNVCHEFTLRLIFRAVASYSRPRNTLLYFKMSQPKDDDGPAFFVTLAIWKSAPRLFNLNIPSKISLDKSALTNRLLSGISYDSNYVCLHLMVHKSELLCVITDPILPHSYLSSIMVHNAEQLMEYSQKLAARNRLAGLSNILIQKNYIEGEFLKIDFFGEFIEISIDHISGLFSVNHDIITNIYTSDYLTLVLNNDSIDSDIKFLNTILDFQREVAISRVLIIASKFNLSCFRNKVSYFILLILI